MKSIRIGEVQHLGADNDAQHQLDHHDGDRQPRLDNARDQRSESRDGDDDEEGASVDIDHAGASYGARQPPGRSAGGFSIPIFPVGFVLACFACKVD